MTRIGAFDLPLVIEVLRADGRWTVTVSEFKRPSSEVARRFVRTASDEEAVAAAFELGQFWTTTQSIRGLAQDGTTWLLEARDGTDYRLVSRSAVNLDRGLWYEAVTLFAIARLPIPCEQHEVWVFPPGFQAIDDPCGDK